MRGSITGHFKQPTAENILTQGRAEGCLRDRGGPNLSHWISVVKNRYGGVMTCQKLNEGRHLSFIANFSYEVGAQTGGIPPEGETYRG